MINSQQGNKGAQGDGSTRSSENLAFLYQGLLTVIVRLQAGREQIPDAQSFRARAKKLLQEAESEARRVGYEADDIKDASLAVVAFLDSVVLNSSEAGHAEWVRQSLAEELFGVANAGEVVFEKLDDVRGRRNSEDLADVLEVYALCLMLGFEGRYSERQRAELNSIKEKTRRRIDDIRGKPEQLSPMGLLPDAPALAEPVAVMVYPIRRYVLIAVGAAVIALLCFIFLKVDLVMEAGRASGKLL